MAQATDLSKLSNVEKYNMKLKSAYGKLSAVPSRQYKKGLAVAQSADAKGTKKAPKKTTRKRVASKSSVW